MRKKKLILISLIYLLALSGAAQNTINTLSVDTKTYTLYEQKKWKELIDVGKESLEKGIDFYYLQYRMGVAYYELKNYRKAVLLFEKVVKETPEDIVAAEYLYYSYLFSGMHEDARLYGRTLPVDLRKKLNIDFERLLINNAGVEFKYYTFDNYETSVEEGDILDQKISDNLWYSNINIKSYSKGNFTLFQGFSYLNGKNKVYNYIYSDSAIEENVRQFQYYLSGNWHLSKGTDFKAAFHYANTKLEALNPDATQNPGHGQGNTESKYFYSSKLNGIAGFLKYGRTISDFDLKATITVSNFDKIVGTQYIPAIGATWYPFGNTNLYWGGEVKYIIAGDVPDYNPGFVYKSNIGIRLFKSVWIEPFMLYGESRNLTDEDAFVVYNSSNTLNYWYGVNLNTSLSKNKLFLYFSWQKYSMTNIYYINFDKHFTDFNISTFLGGIRLSF